MTDDLEREVRRVAGWIGVEVSKSRVRTPGKAGYGLYRVRGSRPIARALAVLGPSMQSRELTEWTPYAFKLADVVLAVGEAIKRGTYTSPGELKVRYAGADGDRGRYALVPTRWTSTYRGRRDLGLAADLEELERSDPAVGAASARYDEMAREIVERSTARGRQRERNAEFQREHLKRRRYGLEQRHAAKLRRNSVKADEAEG